MPTAKIRLSVMHNVTSIFGVSVILISPIKWWIVPRNQILA